VFMNMITCMKRRRHYYLFHASLCGVLFFCWESAALRASSASRRFLRLSINLFLSHASVSTFLYELVSITFFCLSSVSLLAYLYHKKQVSTLLFKNLSLSHSSVLLPWKPKNAINMREILPVGNLRHFSSRNPYLCPFSCLMSLISWSGLWIFVLHILQKFSTPLGWDPAGLDALNAELQVQHLRRTEQRQLVKKQRHSIHVRNKRNTCALNKVAHKIPTQMFRFHPGSHYR